MPLRIYLWSLLLLSFLFKGLIAQTGVGLRFSTSINHFYRAEAYNLIQGRFSNAEIGPFFRMYKKQGGMEMGISYIFKSSGNIPFVAQDFKGGHSTSFRGGQAVFLFGPQFDIFRPKTGYVLGVRSEPQGFIHPDLDQVALNRFYMFLPVGFSLDFPTSFGTVGGSFFYQIGMTNVKRNPFPDRDHGYDGGKQRALQFEITVMYGTGKEYKGAKALKRKK